MYIKKNFQNLQKNFQKEYLGQFYPFLIKIAKLHEF